MAFVSNSDEGLLPEILRPSTSASVSKSPPEIDGLLIATLGASGKLDPEIPQSALPRELSTSRPGPLSSMSLSSTAVKVPDNFGFS